MSESLGFGGQSLMRHKACEKRIRKIGGSWKPSADLKTTIPRPTPRHQKCYMREVFSSSSLSQPVQSKSTRIPVLKTSSRSEEKLDTQPKGKYPAHLRRNPYANVKAKVNTTRTWLRSVDSPADNSLQTHNRLGVPKEGTSVQSPADNSLPTYNRLGVPERWTSGQSPADNSLQLYNRLGVMEGGTTTEPAVEPTQSVVVTDDNDKKSQVVVSLTTKPRPMETTYSPPHLIPTSATATATATEDSANNKSPFEKHVEALLEMWLHLICGVMSAESPASSDRTLTHIRSVTETTTNLRDSIFKILNTLPGATRDLLNSNLETIIEEQKRLLDHYEELKGRNLKLERTQEEEVSRLREELAILGEENKRLDRNYDQEKARAGQLEEQKDTISKDKDRVEETVKRLQERFVKWESKEKIMIVKSRFLERRMKIMNTLLKTNTKRHKRLLKRADKNITKLKAEVVKSNQAKWSLEIANKDLQEELASTRASLDETIYKRNESRERLVMKVQTLRETEAQLEMLKMHISNTKSQDNENTVVKSQNSGKSPVSKSKEYSDKLIEQQHLDEQKANLNHLESTLKEKLASENMLMTRVTSLQRQLLENDKASRQKIKKLHCMVKGLADEKTELEKIIAQKCLELGHQELLMQEELEDRLSHRPSDCQEPKEVTESDSKLGAFIVKHQKTFYTQGFYNKENENVMERMKAFETKFSQDPSMVEKELTVHRENVSELYNLLEEKQMDVTRLERRLLRLQKAQDKERQKEVSSHCCSLAKAFLPNEYRRNYWDFILKREDIK